MAKKKEVKREPVKVEDMPKPLPAVIKIVKVGLNEEFEEPKGWFIKDMHPGNEGEFYAVLVKTRAETNRKVRLSKPVDINL